MIEASDGYAVILSALVGHAVENSRSLLSMRGVRDAENAAVFAALRRRFQLKDLPTESCCPITIAYAEFLKRIVPRTQLRARDEKRLLLYLSEIKHVNGKSTIYRCFSHKDFHLVCGFSLPCLIIADLRAVKVLATSMQMGGLKRTYKLRPLFLYYIPHIVAYIPILYPHYCWL